MMVCLRRTGRAVEGGFVDKVEGGVSGFVLSSPCTPHTHSHSLPPSNTHKHTNLGIRALGCVRCTDSISSVFLNDKAFVTAPTTMPQWCWRQPAAPEAGKHRRHARDKVVKRSDSFRALVQIQTLWINQRGLNTENGPKHNTFE